MLQLEVNQMQPEHARAPQYVQHRRILLKSHPDFSERWLQEQIKSNPSLLGLGDVDVKDEERIQPSGGRLDMLLFDSETSTRYEVELQLGSTDESHIIRTIEYWDNERRRWPQYEHIGVIVAEEITARFFNVISLFNGFIPLIAIQLLAIEVDDKIKLVLSKVLDVMQLGIEEEEEEEAVDRLFWENRASKETMRLVDRLLDIVREVDPEVALNYRRSRIVLARNGVSTNFITFQPKKQYVIAVFKAPQSEELTQALTDAGVDLLPFGRRGAYRLRISKSDMDHLEGDVHDLLRKLAEKARGNLGR
jgi:hypothetical protein